MITLTILKKGKSGKGLTYKRELKLYHSMDLAKKEIVPIVKEMELAEHMKRAPSVKIDAVSYDTSSEKSLLLELRAIKSIENENKNQGGY